MALELQLSTGNARAELQAVEKSIAQLEQAFSRFSRLKAPTNTLDKISSFRGIEASAIASVDKLAAALNRIDTASRTLSNLTKGLNSLARVRVDSIATNTERVARALASLKVPPTITQLASDLARISSVSQSAARGLTSVGRSLATIKAPPGLSSSARSIERLNSSAATAAVGLGSFGRASSLANSTLAGFGIVLGGIGFARFTQDAYQAVTAVDSFKNTIAATQGTDAVAGEWKYLNETADSLKISLEAAAKSYGSFSAAARLAGVSTQDVHKIFTSMSEAARVLKLNQDQVKRSFNALEQMFSKTTVGAEELRQQLGDHLPGAMQLMAQAVGVSTGELMKMMKEGQVLSASALPKFADVLHEKFGAQVPAALRTAQAAITNFQNAIFRISEAFGRGLFGDDFRASLDGLATALNNPAFIQGVQSWGRAIGAFASAATTALTIVVSNFDMLSRAVLAVTALRLAPVAAAWAASLFALVTPILTATRATFQLQIALAAMSGLSGFGVTLQAAFLAAGAGARILMASLGPLGLALAGITFFMPDILAGLQEISVRAGSLGEALGLLADKFIGFFDRVSSASDTFSSIINWARDLLSSIPGVSSAFEFLGRTISMMLNPISTFLELIDRLVRILGGLPPPVYEAADSAKALGEKVGVVNTQSANATNSLNNFGNSARSLSGDLDNSAAAADRAASSYMRAASAASQLPGLTGGNAVINNNTRGSWELPGHTMADFYSGGGVTNSGSGRRGRVPLSAFVGAPHFAGGGVIGANGIPAVLHPNEAVVPLAGGGSIPVQMGGGGGQGILFLLKPLNDLIDINRQTKTEVARVWEATTVQTQLLVGKINMITDGLDRINTSISNGINTLKASLDSGLSSVTSSVGNVSETAIASALAASGIFGSGGADALTSTNGIKGGSIFGGAGQNSALSAATGRTPSAPRIFDEPRKDEMWKNLGEEDAAVEGFKFHIPTVATYEFGQFASGSPNAWKDTNGGFMAMLHPDEAVIPLKDGRSVPVDMPDDMMKRVSDYIVDRDERVMSRSSAPVYFEGGDVKVEVNMTINAKDVESFRASRDQMVRELQTDIDRSIRNIGKRSDIDDPTKRIT